MWIFIISVWLFVPNKAETSCRTKLHIDIRKANERKQVLRLHTALVPSNDRAIYTCNVTMDTGSSGNIWRGPQMTLTYDKTASRGDCGSVVILNDGKNHVRSFRCVTEEVKLRNKKFSLEFKRDKAGDNSNYCIQMFYKYDNMSPFRCVCAASGLQTTPTGGVYGYTTKETSRGESPETTDNVDSGKGLTIAAVVTGLIVVVLIVIIIAIVLIKRKKQRTPEMIRHSLVKSVVRRSTADHRSETSKKRETKLDDIEVVGLQSTTINISDDPRVSGLFNLPAYDNSNEMEHHQPVRPVSGNSQQQTQVKAEITLDDDEFDLHDDTFDDFDNTFDNTNTTFDNSNVDLGEELVVYAQVDKSKKRSMQDTNVQMSNEKENESPEGTTEIYA